LHVDTLQTQWMLPKRIGFRHALHTIQTSSSRSAMGGILVHVPAVRHDARVTSAETTAAFLLERVRAARGPLWDEGSGRVPAPDPPSGPALRTFAERRVRGVPEDVVRGLFAWDRGDRPVDLLFDVPTARSVLARQARGRRCVCLLEDAAARAHGDPRHPDGLTFALHDLCHLEKFVAPEHHAGQVGFFRLVERALDAPAMVALDGDLDDTWRAERDYVIADMNGSAVFLFAALKMKLKLAMRRRGLPYEPALDLLLASMELPDDMRDAARAVSPRRDHPTDARRLLDHFEDVERRPAR
jgi:hypothetical protein